jgi:hypothetical protein
LEEDEPIAWIKKERMGRNNERIAAKQPVVGMMARRGRFAQSGV